MSSRPGGRAAHRVMHSPPALPACVWNHLPRQAVPKSRKWLERLQRTPWGWGGGLVRVQHLEWQDLGSQAFNLGGGGR